MRGEWAEVVISPPRERLTSTFVAEYRPDLISILEGRADTAWTTASVASDRPRFASDNFLTLPGLLSDADTSRVTQYYRTLIETGWMVPAHDPVRWVTGNDPVGRALLRQFLPTVEAVATRPLRESYTFTAEYLPGSVLPMHIDRPQCEYTISLLLDYDPMPSCRRSPWPLEVDAPVRARRLQFHQARGEGVLLKGRELPHGRPALLEKDRCMVIMLHYVDADFPEELMEPL